MLAAMALSRVARKLYESLERGDSSDPDWFEEALMISMNRQVTLDEVIWNAVREIVDHVKQQKAA